MGRGCQVAPGVFLGSDAVARNRDLLRAHGVTHVLNCAAHVCGNYFPAELVYRSLWLMDAPGEELAPLLYSNLDFVERALAAGGRVLVHCSQARGSRLVHRALRLICSNGRHLV